MAFSGGMNFPFGGSTGGVSTIAASNGRVQLNDGIIQMWGSVANIPADGTSTITIPTGFPTSCFQCVPAIAQSTPTDQLEVNVAFQSKTGFGVTVTGGAPGSLATVRWVAVGN